ncbi:MAG: hypothetical protein K2X63_04400, partial [Burkholderiaceae bacterium]|nr:hypothetical protein [Burkholderiaceae bacterium]
MDISQQPVLLWGHTLAEYQLMFDLGPRLLKQRILEIGFGPSSLNSELTQQGGQVISCHELYSFPYQKIVETAACGFQQLAIRLKESQHQFVWKNYADAKALLQSREQVHQAWLADLKAGLAARRYQATIMPTLAFPDHEFGLALCANTQFGHWASTDLNFHLAAIKELCRVAHEVRVFPLLT